MNVNVPALDHDAMMLARFGHKVSANGRLERRIVAALCEHLAVKGWIPCLVDYGDDVETVIDTKSAMEIIFDLDDCWVQFRNAQKREHAVRLVMGNGEDIISDWNYSHGDLDGFSAAMDAFDVEAVL